MKYTTYVRLVEQKEHSNNPILSLEEKVEGIKKILSEYDVIDSVSYEGFDDFDSKVVDGDEIYIVNCNFSFESDLKISDNQGQDLDSLVPVVSDNLIVYFDQKHGIFSQISKILIAPTQQSNNNYMNIYSESDEVDVDITLYYDTFDYLIS